MIVSTTLTNSRADVIGPMLEAIAPEVDLCVVIDTGATDDTMAIAERVLGAKLVAHRMVWPGSFAAARNGALAFGREALLGPYRAPGPTDWIITADTDERLIVPGLRDFLASVPPQFDAVRVPHASGTFAHLRALRATTKASWRMPVHEYLVDVNPTDGRPDWRFECQARPTENRTAKYEGYRATLERLVEEDPNDSRAWYYLGDTCAILGYRGAAARAFQECGQRPGPDGQAAWAWLRLAILQWELGLTEQAKNAARWGLSRAGGEYPELYYLLAWMHYHDGALAGARGCCEAALAIGPRPNRPGFSWPAAQRQLPERLMGWIAMGLGPASTPSPLAPPASGTRAAGTLPVGG